MKVPWKTLIQWLNSRHSPCSMADEAFATASRIAARSPSARTGTASLAAIDSKASRNW